MINITVTNYSGETALSAEEKFSMLLARFERDLISLKESYGQVLEDYKKYANLVKTEIFSGEMMTEGLCFYHYQYSQNADKKEVFFVLVAGFWDQCKELIRTGESLGNKKISNEVSNKFQKLTGFYPSGIDRQRTLFYEEKLFLDGAFKQVDAETDLQAVKIEEERRTLFQRTFLN